MSVCISGLSNKDLLNVIEESNDEIKNLIYYYGSIATNWFTSPKNKKDPIDLTSVKDLNDKFIIDKSVELFFTNEKINVNLKYELIDNLFIKTAIEPIDICVYFFSERLIYDSKNSIVYVLEKFKLNIHDIYMMIDNNQHSTIRSMQILFAFYELGLDPSYTKSEHIKDMISQRGIYVSKLSSDVRHNTNSAILRIMMNYFTIMPNLFIDDVLCNDIISDMLMDYNEELFTLYLKNGLRIYSDYFCGQYNLSINENDTSYIKNINSEFMIKLINLYETDPDIFEPNAYEYILFCALKSCQEKIFEYIVNSNITSEQIKSAINICENPNKNFIFDKFINKYENELSAKDIASLLM